jgi:hypothetical protein
MAKPILVVRLEGQEIDKKDIDRIRGAVIVNTKDEYHVLIANIYEGEKQVKFECYNDCKGLPDIDIEKLINETLNK